MDFAFSEEQELLRRTARELFENESPMTLVRTLLDDPTGYRPDLWKRMAELGWLGLLVPEAYGGAGLGMVDLIPILEEMGRALLPSPFSGHLQGVLALLRAGSEADQAELLAPAAAGERLLSFAITEAAGTERPEDIGTRAERAGAGYRINGRKLFVPHGHNADTLLVVARTGGEGAAGLSLLRVDRDSPGVSVSPLECVDGTRRLSKLQFADSPAQLVGEEGAGFAVFAWVRDRTLVALAAEAAGAAEKVLETAVAYAKEREQFGRPIGVHQAIKHRCAEMLVDVEAAKALACYAAWAAEAELPQTPRLAAMAKARASDAFRRVTADNIQIHGGVGFTWEYDCHLYYKRAKALEVTYGDATLQRERVAQLIDL